MPSCQLFVMIPERLHSCIYSAESSELAFAANHQFKHFISDCYKSPKTREQSKMCVLFVYLNDDDHECPYRLVVANNRDEYWDRPTATAEFRGDDQQWIGGFILLI